MSSKNQINIIRVPGARIRQHLGKIYVITDDDAAFEEVEKEFTSSSQMMFAYRFSPEEVHDPACFADDELAAAAEEFGAQLVTIIPDPEAGDPAFLMYHFDLGHLGVETILFACEADKRIRESLCRFADKNPELLRDEITVQPIARGGGVMMDRRPKGLSAIGFTGRERDQTRQEKEQQLEIAKSSFVKDIMEVRTTGNPEAAKRTDLVLNSIPNSTKVRVIKEFLGHMSEAEIQQLFKRHIDDAQLARDSKVKIIVRKRRSDRKDAKQYEDLSHLLREYRICYQYGDEQEDHPFAFKMRDEYAIYLCCLLMRHEYGDKDIDFSSLEEMFIGAYRFLYGDTYETARGRFGTLLNSVDEHRHSIQGYLKDRLRNIRAGIDSGLSHREDPHIFYFENKSHLHLLKENIILPPGIMETVTRLGHR